MPSNEIAPPEAQEQQFIQSQMENPQVLQSLQGMEPAERAETLRRMYQDYTGQSALNDEAMSQADALRSGAMPKGITTPDGQFIASSPLSHLAKGVNDFRGNMDYANARDKQQALSGDKTQGVMDMVSMMLRGGGKPQPRAGEGSLDAAKSHSDALRYKG
jgi:hypothetical protein